MSFGSVGSDGASCIYVASELSISCISRKCYIVLQRFSRATPQFWSLTKTCTIQYHLDLFSLPVPSSLRHLPPLTEQRLGLLIHLSYPSFHLDIALSLHSRHHRRRRHAVSARRCRVGGTVGETTTAGRLAIPRRLSRWGHVCRSRS